MSQSLYHFRKNNSNMVYFVQYQLTNNTKKLRQPAEEKTIVVVQ